MDLAAKIGLAWGVFGIVRWILVYSRLQPWWHDSIGQTLVIKAAMFAVLLTLLGVLAYIRLHGIWLTIFSWAAVIDICTIGPIMEWRTQVWKRVTEQERRKRGEGPELQE